MKKLIFLCCGILVLLSACSGSNLSVEERIERAYERGVEDGREWQALEFCPASYDEGRHDGYVNGYWEGYREGYIRGRHDLPYYSSYSDFETDAEYEEDWAQYEALFDPDTWEYLYEDELK